MRWIRNKIYAVLERSVLNPINWMAWAAILALAWRVCEALGWRVDTAVISGTADASRGNVHWVMYRGALYALLYFCAVMVAPVLVIGSVLYVAMVKWLGGGRAEKFDKVKSL